MQLPVELIVGNRGQKLTTRDVSKHGVFVQTDEPPGERITVQLWIELKAGPLMANAVVSRSVRKGPVRGCGLQFFALSTQSKQRWDAYIHGLSDSKEPQPSQALESGATFLIRFPTLHRLNQFYEDNMEHGAFYLATPVIRQPGERVGLILIHPITEAEFPAAGQIKRVKADRPRGMEIALLPMREPAHRRFRQFIATGVLPPSEVSPVIDSTPVRKALDRSESISLDIEVDESALDQSSQFQWEEISDNELIFDVDITTADIEEDEESIDFEESGDVQKVDEGDRASSDIWVRVECRNCKLDCGAVDLGPVQGTLGLLAIRRPYWSIRLDRLVSVVRLKTASERDAVFSRLDDATRLKPVSLAFAFEIAAMTTPPRCPSTGGNVRLNRIAKALGVALESLTTPGMELELEGCRCPDCDQRALFAKRIKTPT